MAVSRQAAYRHRVSSIRRPLVIAALTLVALGGTFWQLEQAAAQAEADGRDSVARFICPLH
jgi:hypothetical protein